MQHTLDIYHPSPAIYAGGNDIPMEALQNIERSAEEWEPCRGESVSFGVAKTSHRASGGASFGVANNHSPCDVSCGYTIVASKHCWR